MKQIESAPQDNIVNEEKWTKSQHLSYFQQRLTSMRSKRSPFEANFDIIEKREDAFSVYDDYGVLQYVFPLEQIMTEIYLGRTNGKIQYEIVPDGQANVDELQPAKYAMNFYLDGNSKDNFWKENKSFKIGKATYGTGIFYTGMRCYKDIRHEVKEGVELQGNVDVLNPDNFTEVTHEEWMFFPKNVHIKDFYLDDGAIGSPNLQDAEDCIMKEKVSFKEFELMFGDNDSIDKEAYRTITTGTDDSEKNKNSQSIHQDEIIIYYYFNRITKTYYIVANQDTMLYSGIYLYNDGKLPFASAQHFPNNNCFYGRGLPDRLMATKTYIGEILQDMLSGAEMGNSINLLTGNGSELEQDWSFGGRGINLLKSTGDAKDVQKLDSTINLGYFQNILEGLYDLVIQLTGDNPRAPSESGEKTLGQTEIREANKAVRQSAIDEGYNICLDEAFTQMFFRIKDFASALMSTTIKDSDGGTLKTEFPSIRIDNAEVKKEEGQIVVKDSLGKYGYFELKPGVIQGIGIKIQTSSTSSYLPVLERHKVKEMAENIQIMSSLSPNDPEYLKKITDRYASDNFLDFVDDSYGYDNGKMKSYTEKDKTDKKARKMLVEAQQKTNLALKKLNGNESIQQSEALSAQNQGLGQSEGEAKVAGGGLGGANSSMPV